MSLNTRLIYTNLPKSHALFHLFEAVVNSIHSIDERIKLDKEFEISNVYSRNLRQIQKEAKT